jgi:hypothetical protein
MVNRELRVAYTHSGHRRPVRGGNPCRELCGLNLQAKLNIEYLKSPVVAFSVWIDETAIRWDACATLIY